MHLTKGSWEGEVRLNGKSVSYVSAFLSDQEEWTPEKLKANEGKSFMGSIIHGLGFTLSEEEAQGMIASDSKNAEVLFPYLNGKDLSSHPEQQASRWVINFFDWSEERAKQYAEPFSKVLKEVKPGRQLRKPNGDYKLRRPLPEKWWIYAEKRPALYHAIGRGDSFESHPAGWESLERVDSVICFAQVSKTKYPALVENRSVFDQKLVVIQVDDPAIYPQLLSHVHYFWVWSRGSSMKNDPVYTPSDVFCTFPFLKSQDTEKLQGLALDYDATRASICMTGNIGLTQLYNRFHDEQDVSDAMTQLRDAHKRIDEEVIKLYGWSDIELEYGYNEFPWLPDSDQVRYCFSDPARKEILRRLSRLNSDRYEEEVSAGLHKKNQPKANAAPKKKSPAKRPRAQAAANDSAPLQQVAEPAAQYDMLGGAEEPAPQQGNSWGTNAIDQILAWLEAHPGAQSQQAILTGSGASPEDWADAIAELIRDGDVIEDQGRYRAAS